MKHRNARWLSILVFTVLAVTLACSAGQHRGDRAQAGVRSEGISTINVVAEEFSFSLDASQAGAGTVTFVVRNEGSMQHDFAIRGEGVEEKTPMIDPGESTTLTVQLEPGTYTYVCTVVGHEQLGMQGTLLIE